MTKNAQVEEKLSIWATMTAYSQTLIKAVCIARLSNRRKRFYLALKLWPIQLILPSKTKNDTNPNIVGKKLKNPIKKLIV